jgi:hypothetical protein
MITDYTSYAEVRSILGVNDEEVPDEELALPIWSMLLDDKLSAVSDSVATNVTAIEAIPEAERTAAQKKFLATSSMYAAYATAQELLIALPMFAYKKLTDGKAEVERFDRWADLKAGIERGANAMRLKLRLALAAVDPSYLVPAAVTGLFIVSTGIATDPVTGV